MAPVQIFSLSNLAVSVSGLLCFFGSVFGGVTSLYGLVAAGSIWEYFGVKAPPP